MKLKPIQLGLAGTVTAAVLWLLCSLLVFILPEMMMRMSGAMIHADLSGLNWTLTLSGVLLGLVSWSITAGVTGWVLGYFYNLLVKD